MNFTIANNITYSALKTATQYIHYICPPLFLLIGLPGNLISLTIWVRRIRSSPGSTCLFIAVMCATDTYVLTHGCLRIWLKELPYGFDLRQSLGCSTPLFIFSFFSDLSVWIIILLCIERAVCVWLPMQSRQLCQLQHGALALFTVMFVLAGVNIHFFWTVKSGMKSCESSSESFSNFVYNIWPFIDFAFYSFVPLALISMLNVFILWRLKQTQNRLNQGAGRSGNNNNTPNASNRSGKILRTVVWMTILHFACTMPIVIYFLSSAPICEDDATDANADACDIIMVICTMLQLTNHLTHFFIYSLTSSLFITDLTQLCSTCKCLERLTLSRPNPSTIQRPSKVAEEFEFRANGSSTNASGGASSRPLLTASKDSQHRVDTEISTNSTSIKP